MPPFVAPSQRTFPKHPTLTADVKPSRRTRTTLESATFLNVMDVWVGYIRYLTVYGMDSSTFYLLHPSYICILPSCPCISASFGDRPPLFSVR